MSRARVAGDPNYASDCELLIGNHCTHTSSPFVSSVRNKRFSKRSGSSSREPHPNDAVLGTALGRVHGGTWCGYAYRDELFPNVRRGRSAHPPGLRIGMKLAGSLLRIEVAEVAMDQRGQSGERGRSGSDHASPAKRIVCRPKGRK